MSYGERAGRQTNERPQQRQAGLPQIARLFKWSHLPSAEALLWLAGCSGATGISLKPTNVQKSAEFRYWRGVPILAVRAKEVPAINLVSDIGEVFGNAIGDDDIGLGLEGVKVANHP